MPRIWSTANVHPRDRVACWVDGLCDTIVHVDCEPRLDQPFFGELCADSAGEIRAATYSSVGQVVTRSPRKIGQRPSDVLTLGVQLVGQAFGSQDGRELVLRPGDLVLYDTFALSASHSTSSRRSDSNCSMRRAIAQCRSTSRGQVRSRACG
jgi:hypothetical protein